ncbi:E3 ubiquitin-protein ligase SIAH1-like protein, partial [Aphelenchoides avenae]
MTTLSIPNSALVALFQCPVCYEPAMPPYLCCPTGGHVVCNSCSKQVKSCPVCRGLKPIYRNLFMKQVSDLVLFPCKWTPFGCSASVPRLLKDHHEDTCLF